MTGGKAQSVLSIAIFRRDREIESLPNNPTIV
jgi:hypothetical protein